MSDGNVMWSTNHGRPCLKAAYDAAREIAERWAVGIGDACDNLGFLHLVDALVEAYEAGARPTAAATRSTDSERDGADRSRLLKLEAENAALKSLLAAERERREELESAEKHRQAGAR